MKVLVVGATGQLGLEIVKEAQKAGHTVTAMVRSSTAQFPEGVRTVQGDVLRPETLAQAVVDQDAVISSLGSKISFNVRGCGSITIRGLATKLLPELSPRAAAANDEAFSTLRCRSSRP